MRDDAHYHHVHNSARMCCRTAKVRWNTISLPQVFTKHDARDDTWYNRTGHQRINNIIKYRSELCSDSKQADKGIPAESQRALVEYKYATNDITAIEVIGSENTLTLSLLMLFPCFL